jgi:hypothetical protein
VYAKENEPCQVTWNPNAEKYKEVNTKSLQCDSGLVCFVESDTGTADGSAMDGLCKTETCSGQKDNNAPNEATRRVTICHRTCSATNPWVRITIDDDAWGGEFASGCGHQLHNVEQTCASKAPWTEWGTNRVDYLLKEHGTREQVRLDNGWSAGPPTSQEEKDYWTQWERACPYVRGTDCCDWASGSCCGDPPAPAPTPAPVGENNNNCVLPLDTEKYSLITEGNTVVAAHTIYTGVAVGGTFQDDKPGPSKTVDGASYINVFVPPNGASYNWNKGKTTGVALSDVIDFEHFKWLAENAKSSESGAKKVIVLTHGGTFNTADFRGSDGQGSDNGNTLVIFNTSDKITLTKTDGTDRQFGPSVIAPFSEVELLDKAGFIDGFVVAKSFRTSGCSASTSLQMHGKTYSGSIECNAEGTFPTPAPVSPTPAPPVISNCEPNLGSKLSEGTDLSGGDQSVSPYPKIHNGAWQRADDSVSLLVGGNYLGRRGAEIEGKIVCLGDFDIRSGGPADLVEAGVVCIIENFFCRRLRSTLFGLSPQSLLCSRTLCRSYRVRVSYQTMGM